MTPQELKAMLDDHARWRVDPVTGRRANLSGADLRWAVFADAKLDGILLAHLTVRMLRGETFTL